METICRFKKINLVDLNKLINFDLQTSKNKMIYSASQQRFVDLVLAGRNVFMTGKAGTGKSFITTEAISMLKEKGVNVAAVAPTGVAANNVGGQTIHSLFNINPYGVATFESSNFLKGEKRRILEKINVIFIDEVSMLRPDVLDAINWTFLRNGLPGLETRQVVFIGDLAQLPSPIDDNTRSVLYQTYNGDEFYHAGIYKRFNVVEIELIEILRQSDPEFIDALNIVRDGGKSPYFKQFVGNSSKGIVLAPHNATVERYNREGLDALKSEEIVFDAVVYGNAKADDFNLPTVIKTKNGAKIMHLINSPSGELVNGTLGIFVSHNDCHYIRVGNVDYALQQVEFTKKEYRLRNDRLELVEIGSIRQYPFKLAYALSIHKAQGLTFDEVTVDLTRPCFAKGQMYVALSRVTKPEGLTIIH